MLKEVKGYPEYLISSDGFVRSNHYKKKILKPDENSCGYLRVTLCRDGKTKRFFLHKLVAEHFIDNPENLDQVNHLDGDKKNNNISNLEWSNQRRNQLHAYREGLQSPLTKIKEDSVIRICRELSKGTRIKDILLSHIEGATRDIITDIKRKKTWKHISKDYF